MFRYLTLNEIFIMSFSFQILGLADPHGRASEALNTLYGEWSKSGCGILFTGNVQTDRRYIERPGNVCIDGEEDEQSLQALKALAAAGTSEPGVHFWMQISHGGRQSNGLIAKRAPAASPVKAPSVYGTAEPYEMTEAQIEEQVQKYAHAARVAKQCNFTGVQLHSAHGYLLSSFLSPRSNRRKDKYGGSLENRARFLMESIRAVREAVGPDFPVSVKLNSSDFQRGGFTHEEAITVAKWVDAEGLDLLEISGGTYESLEKSFLRSASKEESTRQREAYFLEYAKDIQKSLQHTPLMVTGGFRSRATMEDAITNDSVAVIGIGRPLCVNTRCVQELFDGEREALPTPELDWALPRLVSVILQPFLGDLVRPAAIQPSYYSNIVLVSEGKEPEQRPSIIANVFKDRREAARKAKAILETLPTDDPTLVNYKP